MMMEHFNVKFGDPSCSGFWDIVQKNRQTDTAEHPTPASTVSVGNKNNVYGLCADYYNDANLRIDVTATNVMSLQLGT